MPLLPKTRLLLARKATDLLQPIRGTPTGRALHEELEEEIKLLQDCEKRRRSRDDEGPLLQFDLNDRPLQEYTASSPHPTHRRRHHRPHRKPHSDPGGRKRVAEPAARRGVPPISSGVEEDGPAMDMRTAHAGGGDYASSSSNEAKGKGIELPQTDPPGDTTTAHFDNGRYHRHSRRGAHHRRHSSHHASREPQKTASPSRPKFSWRKGLPSYVEALVEHELGKRIQVRSENDKSSLDRSSGRRGCREPHRRSREDDRTSRRSASSRPLDRYDRRPSRSPRRSRKGKEPGRTASSRPLEAPHLHISDATKPRSAAVLDAQVDDQAGPSSSRGLSMTSERASDRESKSHRRSGEDEYHTGNEAEGSRGGECSTAAGICAPEPSFQKRPSTRVIVTKGQRRRMYGLSRAEIIKESGVSEKDRRDQEGEREAWGWGDVVQGIEVSG